MNQPPSNCPNCNGQREWDGATAVCYFCGMRTVANPAVTMNRKTADRIYSVLVEHAGALAESMWRDAFVDHLERHDYLLPLEFRFMGSLGFGGKFKIQRERGEIRWFVDCYSEDQTPERLKAIIATNVALDQLRRTI